MAKRVAIIGGGPAGSAAAYVLRRRGFHVVIFERASSVGGRTRTFRSDGLVIDTGAAFFTTFYPVMRAMLPELGLDTEVEPIAASRPVTLLAGGTRHRIVATRPWTAMTMPQLGPAARLRALAYAGRQMLRRPTLDFHAPESLARHDDRTIAEATRPLLGEAAYQYLVRPTVEPFWYFSCEEASAALIVGLLAHAAGSRFFRLRGGMDLLCQRLCEGVELRTATSVTGLTWNGQGLRVTAGDDRHGREESIDFDGVLVATTADVAHSLVGHLPSTVVQEPMRRYLASQRYAPCTFTAFGTDGPVRRERAAFPHGPGDHPVAALAFQEASPETGIGQIVSIYEREGSAPSAQARSGDGLWLRARSFDDELPAAARQLVQVVRRNAIPVHDVGRFRQGIIAREQQCGPLGFAGDYLGVATIEGAMRSGMHAAERLLPER